MHKPNALMLASVASMIDLFNADNISLLREEGYIVDVAANFEKGSITSKQRVNEYKNLLEKDGTTVYNIPFPRSVTNISDIIHSYKLVKKIVDSNRYRIVHCHSPIGGVVCRLACQRSRKLYGTKVIYTAHGFHFFKGANILAWMFFYPIEKFCSRFTDVLITINKEDYIRAQNFHAQRIKYVHGIGVHTKIYAVDIQNKEEKRRELGISENDFVFMSTGQVSVRKNHEVIIRALAMLHDERVKYLIVGFGELEEKLKALARELKIDNQVIFAGYRSDVRDLLHAVDAFAFPSLQEGLPVALMEAMAAGLPVICSKIRGNTDLIEDGKGGYLFDCGDIEGFCNGMKKIVREETTAMGRFNQEVMSKYDITVVNREMQNIYRELK